MPTLPLPHEGETEAMTFPEHTESGILQAALSSLAAATATTGSLIQTRAAQLSGDTQSMWAAALTSPTVSAAHGMRVAYESGAGRTRTESNTPASTQVVGPQ